MLSTGYSFSISNKFSTSSFISSLDITFDLIMIFIFSPLSTSNRKKFKFYKVHYNLSNFHKILSTQNAMDTPNETEETTTAINGK